MNKIFVFLLLILAVSAGTVRAEDSRLSADETRTGRIRVRITGLRSHDGELSLALFNDRKGFPGKDDRAFRSGNIPASGEEHLFTFDSVPCGTYALSVRHDENRNGKLDTNFLGMPKEGVGVSNNPRSRFGPPSFKDASFTLEGGETELVIQLRYL